MGGDKLMVSIEALDLDPCFCFIVIGSLHQSIVSNLSALWLVIVALLNNAS